MDGWMDGTFTTLISITLQVRVTHGVLRWSRWVFGRTLLAQTGHSPGLLDLRVEHSEDQHHRQALGDKQKEEMSLLVSCALVLLLRLQEKNPQNKHKTFSSDLHDAKDIKDVVESEDAVVDGHQAAQPRGGGHQQQHEGVSNGAAVETHRGN